MWELNRALKQISNTAPGKDNITYSMLYHPPEGLKRSLLNIFNRIWNNEIALPTDWNTHSQTWKTERRRELIPSDLACILYPENFRENAEKWTGTLVRTSHKAPRFTIWVQKE
ncbi:hypothetical protein JTB14_010576 [Gonioctena quinquepunctata]|nr:hypothetical protein JTB14_010576 [Gonioctena quinquepunctata]